MLYGIRISLFVGAGALAIGMSIGVPVGYCAGYAGRWADAILMRLIDTMLAFPGIIMALVVLTVLGTGTREVAITLGIGAIPNFARLARGQVLQEKERDYVLAARTLGAGPLRIIMRHIAINTLPPLLVQAALVVAFSIVGEGGAELPRSGRLAPDADARAAAGLVPAVPHARHLVVRAGAYRGARAPARRAELPGRRDRRGDEPLRAQPLARRLQSPGHWTSPGA